MANLDGTFDAESEKSSEGFDLIPDGTYEAIIIESERKKANSGKGDYISLTFQIIGPTHAGRRIWHNLNLWNDNPQAVQISRGNLAEICRAVNVLKIKDSSELHNLPMLIKVGTRKRKDNDELQNQIKGWKPKGGGTAAPATAQQPATTAAPAAAGSAPWGKKATG